MDAKQELLIQQAEERYLRAKVDLEEILNGKDRCATTFNAFAAISVINGEQSESFTCKLQQVGLGIIQHIEDFKNKNLDENSLTVNDLAYTLNALKMFIYQTQYEATDISDLLKQLKTKIQTQEYNKLASKISMFVGLSVMLASTSILIFCLATGGASLIPLAVGGLCFVGPIIMVASCKIYGDHLSEAIAQGKMMNYFFKSTTPDSETARKTLFILEAAAP